MASESFEARWGLLACPGRPWTRFWFNLRSKGSVYLQFCWKRGFCVLRPHPRTESTLWPVLASKFEPLGTKSRAPAAQNGPAGSVQSSRDSQVWVFGSVLPPVGFVEGLQGWLRSNKCARKCCSGLIWSCLALPNADRACSEAAYALKSGSGWLHRC